MKIISLIKKYKFIFLFFILVSFSLFLLRFYLESRKSGLPSSEKPSPLEKEETPFIPEKELEPEKYQPSPIPKDWSESEVIEQETEESLSLYPLIDYLPLENERFILTYNAPLVLEVTLKQGTEEEIKQEISDWITSKNIDPTSHQVIFK